MAVVTIGAAVDLGLVKMKWREQYVSEGLNRKTIPAAPRGIYRGLRLAFDGTQGGTDRRVAVVSTPDGTHEAVSQNTTGHALTYIDNDGTSLIFDLSAPDLDNKDVVIALYVDYQVGVDTAAEWRAYPEADYLALPAADRDDLIVLGMVRDLVLDTNVAADKIFVERRTMAWENMSSGGRQWAPLIEAPGFEVGSVSTTGKYDIAHWVAATTGGTGTWDLGGDANSGDLGLRVTSISGATFVSTLRREVGIHLRPGQMIRYRLFKKVQTATTGGDVELGFDFTDGTLGSAPDTHTVSIPATTTNPGFIEVEGTFTPEEAGATANVLKSIYLRMSGVDSTTTVDFDDIQVWAEQVDGGDSSFQGGENIGGVSYASPLFLMGKASGFGASDQAAVLEYASGEIDIGNPANISQAGAIGTAEEAPDIRQRGGLLVGEGKLRNTTEIGEPRIDTAISSTAGQRTLIWKGTGGTTYESRLYAGDDGELVMTTNASFSNVSLQWSADDTGSPATKVEQTSGDWSTSRKGSTGSAWNDASWDAHQPLVLGDDPLAKIFLSDTATQAKQALVVEEDPAADGTFNALVHIKKNTDSGSQAPALLIEKKPPTGTGSTGPAFRIETGDNQFDRAIEIDNQGTSNALFIDHSPPGGSVSNAVTIITDSTTSGESIYIDHNGSGRGIEIDHDGSGDGIYVTNAVGGNGIEVQNNTSSSAVYVEQNGSGYGMEIQKDGTANIALYVDQNTANDAIQIDCTSGMAMDINATSTGSTDVIDISSSRTGGAIIDAHAGSMTSGYLFQFTGPSSATCEMIRYGRMRVLGGTGSANTGSILQMNQNYSSFAGNAIQVTCLRAGSSAYNFMQFYANNGSDPSWRVDGTGKMYADVGTIGTPADYAEYVTMESAIENYEPGDVIVFGSNDSEFGTAGVPSSPKVAGVYSTDPLILGNNSPGCGSHNCDVTTGTLEGNDWTLGPKDEDPEESDFTRLAVFGNRLIDYEVGDHIRFNASTVAEIASVAYDGDRIETVIELTQGYPNGWDHTTHALYHSMLSRNVIPMAMLGQVPTKCIAENGTISPGDMLVTSSTVGHAMKAGGSPALGTILGKAMETLTDTGGGADIGMMMVYVNLH